MGDKILLLGDSHTYGDGLNDVSLVTPWSGYSHNTWAYHMFKDSSINNKSFTGCSNDMIYLRLVRHAEKNDLIVIMFTFPERIHITRKGCNLIASPSGSIPISDNGDENWVAKQVNEQFVDPNVKLIVNHFDDNLLEILFLKNILMCQTYCISRNLEYYFTMVDYRTKIKCKGSLEKYRDSLHDSIDWTKIFLVEGQHGFQNYAEKIKAKKGLDNEHWGIGYHKLFGNLFLDWINKKNQL